MIWMILAILVLLLLLLMIFIFMKKKKKHKTDYYYFFIIGIIWFGVGMPLDNSVLTILGAVFMVIGLVHKKDWKKNHRTWVQLSKEERKWKMWLIIGLVVLVVLTFVAFLLTK